MRIKHIQNLNKVKVLKYCIKRHNKYIYCQPYVLVLNKNTFVIERVNPISFMSLAGKQRFKKLLEEITWNMFHIFHLIDIFC